MSRSYSWLFAAWFVLLRSNAAHATPDFPSVIATKLALKGEPPCVLCHATELGEKNTVTRPFGKRVFGYGLRSFDVATLGSLLDQMRDAGDDSDHDGKSD